MSEVAATSRKGTIRRCGHIWSSNNTYYDDDWHTTIDERFHISTWKFGSIHQAKVFIDYNHLIDGKEPDSFKVDGSVGICLRYGKTMEEAMRICLDYIEEFKKNGPPSVDQLFQDSWDHWPTLYVRGRREPVICQTFFTIGGGYTWVDGAVMCTSPHDYLESVREERKDEGMTKALEACEEVRKMSRERKLAKGEELDYWDYTREEQDEMRWGQGVFNFYPASEGYSNVCLVPDDVKPEWLELAYEAAILLRDKSGVPKMPKSRWHNEKSDEDDQKRQADNRVLGAKVVAELERRFPHVKKGE
jgi:hypothetical protein